MKWFEGMGSWKKLLGVVRSAPRWLEVVGGGLKWFESSPDGHSDTTLLNLNANMHFATNQPAV